MLKTKLKRSNGEPRSVVQQGFTIIEVLIVLAIAGLILLIVFLAVPALQRNARNTSLKSDAASIGAAVNEFENNNQGLPPTGIAIAAGVVTVSGGGTTTPATGKVQGGTTGTGSTTATAPTATQLGVINIKIGNKCNGNALGAAAGRSVAILYNLETASSSAPQCLES